MTTVRPMTWVERNLSVIVTVIVLLLGGAVTWGKMLTGFDNIGDRVALLETMLRSASFIEGPATDAEQNRRILLLETAVAALNGIVADMRAYDARMEERLAGLTSQLSRIENGVAKLTDQVAQFTRMAVP